MEYKKINPRMVKPGDVLIYQPKAPKYYSPGYKTVIVESIIQGISGKMLFAVSHDDVIFLALPRQLFLELE